MTDAPGAEGWANVGRVLSHRVFKDLRWTKAELIRRSGISDKTVSRYLAGEAIVRRDKERALSAAVGWTPDSIERILAGREPIALESGDQADEKDATDRDAWVIEQLADINRKLDAIQAALNLRDERRPATPEEIDDHTLANINESLTRSPDEADEAESA